MTAAPTITGWRSLPMVVLLALVFALLRGRLGASVQAIRDDEDAAESVGVRVLAGKRTIFFLAAFGCALAGSLWLATSISFQPRTYFGIQWTAYMIFMVLVGGLGTFEGPILGAIIFFLIEYLFGETGVWYFVGLGAAAIVFALFLPRGLWGTIEDRFGIRLASGRLPPALIQLQDGSRRTRRASAGLKGAARFCH